MIIRFSLEFQPSLCMLFHSQPRSPLAQSNTYEVAALVR